MRKIHVILVFFITLLMLSCKPEIENYVITFNDNGGEGAMAAQVFEAEEPTPLNSNTYICDGHEFMGWGITATSDVVYANQATYTATNDATLYAVWNTSSGGTDTTGTTFTITFHNNGGEGVMEPQIVEENVPTQLTNNAFTYEGHNFAGWSTTALGDVEFANQATYTATENTTLYAVWNEIGGNLGIEMVYIVGGTFSMGSSSQTSAHPIHNVTLSSFYMGIHEVTQAQWTAIMEDNPSFFSGANHPVERVTWYEVIEYCNALSIYEGLTPCYTIAGTNVTINQNANGYRLPTEAQWEYAAKGGIYSSGFTYSGSNQINDVAWYLSNSNESTHPVGSKYPNVLKLYDMSGNVSEWCWDWLSNSYNSGDQIDPTGAPTGQDKVARSGSWRVSAQYCTSSYRDGDNPHDGDNIGLGFRLVRIY